MPDTVQGIVKALDRANGVVRAALTDGTEIEAAAFFGSKSRAPWPLCNAHFVFQNGGWVCWGPLGDRRVVVHDDFTFTAAVSVAGTNAAVACDTPWNIASALAGSTGSTAGVAVAEGQGVCRLRQVNATAGSVGTDLRKGFNASPIALPTPPAAVWFATRIQLANTPSDTISGFQCGLIANPGGSQHALFMAATGFGANWRLLDWASNAQISGVTIAETVGAWATLEAVILGADRIAGWINGDGPYVLGFAGATLGTTLPTFTITTAAGQTDDVYIDAFTLHVVSPVNDPTPYRLN